MDYLRETRDWLSPNHFSDAQHHFSGLSSICPQYEETTNLDLKSQDSSSCSTGSVKLKRKRKRKEEMPLKARSERNIRILVVDDDPIICDVIKDVLEGYEIDFAFNGRDAAQKIKQGHLDLIIMDYHVPDLDGRQLYEWIETDYPHLKNSIVFSTGDMFDEDIRRFIERTGCPCLYKPFANSDLRKAVSEMISA